MNKKIKAQWVAALRSGEYLQVKRTIRNNDGYCCLGVLSCLAVKNGALDEDDAFQRDLLSNAVRKWAEISEDSCAEDYGDYDPVINNRGLAQYNDGDFYVKSLTFNKIADLIEQSSL